MNSIEFRFCWRAAALAGLVGLLCAPARAQLTDAQLVAMKEQGRREGWTFTVGRNGATSVPLENLCGLKPPADWAETDAFDESPPASAEDLPAAFDWRNLATLPPVRNQGNCGSCWAFATVGVLECALAIEGGQIVDLSEQWLVNCNREGWGCDGGWWAHDYHWWKSDHCGGVGSVLEGDLPYAGVDGGCNCPYNHHHLIDSWSYVGATGGVPSVASIKQAIYDRGPLSVAIVVDGPFYAYTGGVYNHNAQGEVNHGVILTGWDDSQGAGGIWIMRNSWGAGWGEGGYMRIQYNCASIGYGASYINCTPSAPTVDISGWITGDTGGTTLLFYNADGSPLGSVATEANGFYRMTGVPSGWSGSVRALRSGHIYCPPMRHYSNVTASLGDQNFAGARINGSETCYNYESGADGWQFLAPGGSLTQPSGVAWSSALVIQSNDNRANFGCWNSPAGVVPMVDNTLYRSVWRVFSNMADAAAAPTLRMRSGLSSYQQTNLLQLDSTGAGACSPNTDGQAYALYFESPLSTTGQGWFLAFDLINFNPDDWAGAHCYLDAVTVDRLAVPGPGAPARNWEFNYDSEGWGYSGTVGTFSAPQGDSTGGALSLTAVDNANCFGFWSSNAADLSLGGVDTLYRATFQVASDQYDPARAPTARFRLNASDFQSGVGLRIDSAGDGANSPATSPVDYSLYYLAPASAAGAGLIASFDLINFSADDAAGGRLSLERVAVETLAVP